MTIQEPEEQAEALDAFLHGKLPADHPNVPQAEARLGAALKSTAQEIQPPAQFEAELERSLMRQAQHKPASPYRKLAAAGRATAWAGLAIVLLLGLSWVFRTLLPAAAPDAAPTGSASPVTALSDITETPQIILSVAPAEPTLGVTPVESPVVYRLPMLPETQVILQAGFPEAPGEVQLYRQSPWPELSAESALQVAQQLGVEGRLYTSPAGPPGAASYLVSDGFAQVFVQQAAPWFQYRAAAVAGEQPGAAPPAELALAAAEDFLKAHSLDAFEYQAKTQARAPGEVAFIQTLEGRLVSFPPLDAPKVRVVVNAQFQATQVESNRVDFEPLGSYPVITAQQAWENALSPDTRSGLQLYETSLASSAIQTWRRAYPLDQDIELFGYARSYAAVDPGASPLIFFNDYPVTGNTQGLVEAAASNRFIQAWGQLQQDAQGRIFFQVTGWQGSFFPDQTLLGTIQRQNGQVYLVSLDQRWLLPQAPDDLPELTIISAQGVILEEPEATLEWSRLYAGPLGGGGGGGGSGFAELNLSAAPAAPAQPAQPEPTPAPLVLAGQRVEGAQGIPLVFIDLYSDGSTQVEVILHFDPSAAWPEGLTVRLDGPGLQEVDAYHNLPLRVWGEITQISDLMPTLTVERFEPVYPDLKVEAWLGLLENLTLGDQQVLRLTTQAGEQFVLKTSIENPGADELPGAASDPAVVEGILIPGQMLGDYPVITDYLVLPKPGLNDLSEYQPFSAAPIVSQKSGTAGERRTAVITQIELVYITDDPRPVEPSASGMSDYAQPAWRFSGEYEDGSSFILLVQALSPQYLR